MSRFLVLAIRIYRQVAAAIGFQRNCLFHESCSAHVERVSLDRGLLAGLAAARWRLTVCRPGYRFQVEEHSWTLVLQDGTHVAQALVSTPVSNEAKALIAATRLEIP